MSNAATTEDIKLGAWQYFMLFLSLLALVLLAVQTFLTHDVRTRELLIYIDHVVCAVFFTDFVWQLLVTKPKWKYLKWGWLDLLSSIPLLPELRIARLSRVIRIIRVLRGVKASRHMISYALLYKAKNAFAAVILGSVVLILFSTIAIYSLEPELSPRDAIWWCIFTLITGEYGDYYPQSNEARVITVMLMTAGVALFGTFTATVASVFLEKGQVDDEKRDLATIQKIEELKAEIDKLKNITAERISHGQSSQENR